jgi:hypothetical protein
MSTNYVQKATGASPPNLTDSLIFDDGSNVGIGTTSPPGYSSPGLTINGTAPCLILRDSAAGSDERLYDFYASGDNFYGRIVSDSGGASSSWINVRRDGTNITGVAINNPPGSFVATEHGHLEVWLGDNYTHPGTIVLVNPDTTNADVGNTIVSYAGTTDRQNQGQISWFYEAATTARSRSEVAIRSSVLVYSAGTVNVTSGSNAVTGNGTSWTGALEGTRLYVGANSAFVAAVNSSTSITLAANWPGGTASTQSYKLLDESVKRCVTFKTYTLNDIDYMAMGVGGTASIDPMEPLHVLTNSDGQGIRLERTDSTTGRYSLSITSVGDFDLAETGVASRLHITKSSGNVGIGGTAFGTSAAKVLGLYNGTAPGSSQADGVQLYAQDVSSSSELMVRDEAGNVTQLSPHNFALLGGPSEELAWAYYSERDGRRINVDMLRALRILEKLSGERLVVIE